MKSFNRMPDPGQNRDRLKKEEETGLRRAEEIADGYENEVAANDDLTLGGSSGVTAGNQRRSGPLTNASRYDVSGDPKILEYEDYQVEKTPEFAEPDLDSIPENGLRILQDGEYPVVGKFAEPDESELAKIADGGPAVIEYEPQVLNKVSSGDSVYSGPTDGQYAHKIQFTNRKPVEYKGVEGIEVGEISEREYENARAEFEANQRVRQEATQFENAPVSEELVGMEVGETVQEKNTRETVPDLQQKIESLTESLDMTDDLFERVNLFKEVIELNKNLKESHENAIRTYTERIRVNERTMADDVVVELNNRMNVHRSNIEDIDRSEIIFALNELSKTVEICTAPQYREIFIDKLKSEHPELELKELSGVFDKELNWVRAELRSYREINQNHVKEHFANGDYGHTTQSEFQPKPEDVKSGIKKIWAKIKSWF